MRRKMTVRAVLTFVIYWPDCIAVVMLNPSARPTLTVPGIRLRVVILIMMTGKRSGGQDEHRQSSDYQQYILVAVHRRIPPADPVCA